jgi:hypothetical protein
MRTPSVFFALSMAAATVWASVDPPVDVGERAKGAKTVILATVTNVQSAFGENDFGDRLILSQVSLRVDETMKGPHEATVVVTLEGGTVGDLTLEVSDMPKMEKGQRAVLFLISSAAGGQVPHGRGAGVMKVDADNRVTGTDLTVDDIRAAVKAAQAQGNQ